MSAYQWKSGSRIKGDAQKAGELFEKLSQTEQGLTARTLLDANKPKNAPLHNDYEWNDEIAAEEWRLHQSRHFLNSLTITMITEKNEQTLVRAVFITTEKSKYEPITAIIQDKSKYSELLETAKQELYAFQRKYANLKELKPVFNAIKEV